MYIPKEYGMSPFSLLYCTTDIRVICSYRVAGCLFAICSSAAISGKERIGW